MTGCEGTPTSLSLLPRRTLVLTTNTHTVVQPPAYTPPHTPVSSLRGPGPSCLSQAPRVVVGSTRGPLPAHTPLQLGRGCPYLTDSGGGIVESVTSGPGHSQRALVWPGASCAKTCSLQSLSLENHLMKDPNCISYCQGSRAGLLRQGLGRHPSLGERQVCLHPTRQGHARQDVGCRPTSALRAPTVMPACTPLS